MTNESYHSIQDTLLGVVGAAAAISGIGEDVATAAQDSIHGPESLRIVARTIQAQAQRAALACLSLAGHAGRLESFAHMMLVVQARDEGARVALANVAKSNRPDGINGGRK